VVNLSWRALPTSALLILFAGSAAAVDGGGLGSTGLGVRVIPTTQQLREALGVGADEGALVMEVTRGTPAHRAGLRAGDVLTRVGRVPVGDSRDIAFALGARARGRTVELRFVRGRIALGVVASLPPRPGPRFSAAKPAPGQRRGGPLTPGGSASTSATVQPPRADTVQRCPPLDQQLERRLRRLEQRLRRLEEGRESNGAVVPNGVT
jgi:membrane-associated protease RseP (regulator of RpoE activity)